MAHMTPINTEKEINIVGQPAIFIGSPTDSYFDNLAAFAETNDTLLFATSKCAQGGTVLDIGANIGVTAVMLTRLLHPSQLLCFEPTSTAFGYLNANLTRNEIDASAFNLAVGNSEGKIYVKEEPMLAGSFVTHDIDTGSSVEVLPLDTFVERNALTKITFIKIDVEGFELDILQGASETLRAHDPLVVMEFNSYALTAIRNISPRSLADYILKKYGHFHTYRDGELQRISSIQDVRNFLYSNMAQRGCIDDVIFGGAARNF
jgi:FkbM family methyltransferase